MSDFEDINKIIFNLLTFRRSSAKETTYFKGKKHNKELCPTLKEQLDNIQNTFNKYRKITYDIQGVRDNGTDVLIRDSSSEPQKYICFQIKNEDDFIRGDCLKELKSQYYDSRNKFINIVNYYIFLCADIYTNRPVIDLTGSENKNNIKLNRQAQINVDIIRNISADFSTESNIYIIDPAYCYTFLNLNLFQIDAIAKSIFGNEDIVFQKAIDITSSMLPVESAIIYFMIDKFIYEQKIDFDLNEIEASSILNTICNDIPDYNRDYFDMTQEEIRFDFESFYQDGTENTSIDVLRADALHYGIFTKGLSKEEIIEELYEHFIDSNYTNSRTFTERLQSSIDYLEENYLTRNEAGKYSLSIIEIRPLIILELDAMERYGYSGCELINYMLDLLNKISQKF